MKTLAFAFSLCTSIVLSGCGGIVIKETGASNEGYRVYAPRVLVNVTETRTCKKPQAGGACPEGEFDYSCTVSAPFYLPNFDEEYMVRFKRGVGSYSGEVSIVNGWMLGGAKESGDTNSFVSTLTGAAGLGTEGFNPSVDRQPTDADQGCKAGMYELGRNGVFVLVDRQPWQ